MRLMCVCALFVLFLSTPCSLAAQTAKSLPGAAESRFTTLGLPRYQTLTINNITAWYRSDGLSNRSPAGREGVFYPRSTKWVVYQDNHLWGGRAFLDSAYSQPHPTQFIRVGGGTYTVGTGAGRVIGFGSLAVPADPNSPDVRMYRVRRDYFFMTNGAHLALTDLQVFGSLSKVHLMVLHLGQYFQPIAFSLAHGQYSAHA